MTLPAPASSWLADALSRLRRGQSFVLATVVGPPGHPRLGQHVLADPAAPDQVSGDQLPALVEAAWNKAVIATSQKHLAILCSVPLKDRDAGHPLSMVEIFMSWCGPPAEAWIFGAGHIGLALTPLLSQLGWRVVICDDRPEFVTVARFPDAHQCRAGDFAIAGRACASRPDVWAILVTRGHLHDEQILRELRSGRPRYVGMIGSHRRVAAVRNRLATDGASPHLLEILHSPVGLPIGAESPMEIAVSIAAEMVSVRRATQLSGLCRRGQHRRDRLMLPVRSNYGSMSPRSGRLDDPRYSRRLSAGADRPRVGQAPKWRSAPMERPWERLGEGVAKEQSYE